MKQSSITVTFLLLLAGVIQASDRPNFLIIIADDLCYRDLGFMGSTQVKTPNLDMLASQGMTMTHMFTPAPMCSPCRHSLYTGLFCVRAGAYPNHTRVYEGTHSIFTYLKREGYRVALQRKSHVGPSSSFPYEYIGSKKGDDLEQSEAFMTEDEEQPWMLVFASNDPHSPWTRGPQDLYDPKTITVPHYYHDNPTTRENLAKHYAEITMLDSEVGKLMQMLKRNKLARNTFVLFVSEQGNSLPYGGKWSLYDNGIRVASIARWPGRIQAGARTDALVQYPDVVPTMLEAAGIDPSKIDTGCPDADGKTGFDGKSFLKLLTGAEDSHREFVFSEYTTVGVNGYKEPYPMRAVRDSRFKLIRNLASENTYTIGGIHKVEPTLSWIRDAKTNPELQKKVDWLFHRPAEELYDLETDPDEIRNLADDPKYAEIQKQLGLQLDEWMRQQKDKGLQTELKAHSRQGKNRQKNKKTVPKTN